jgi:hypothetical protein
LPGFIDLDVTEDYVEKVARRLSGAAGLGGTDACCVLKQWLLRFSPASRELRQAVADFMDWLSNASPLWAAYRAIMDGRLLALNKSPGIRPVGIGETWRQLFAKILLLIMGDKAQEVCGIDQLCAGLQAGIKGGGTCGNNAQRKKNGVFFSLMRGTHSTS